MKKISCPDTFKKVIEKNIPQEVIDSAVCIESFGDIPSFTSPKNQDWLLFEHVNRLIQAVASEQRGG